MTCLVSGRLVEFSDVNKTIYDSGARKINRQQEYIQKLKYEAFRNGSRDIHGLLNTLLSHVKKDPKTKNLAR